MTNLETRIFEVVKAYFGQTGDVVFAAGGYARDRWFGKDYQDVDLVVPLGLDTDEQYTFGQATALCDLLCREFSGLTVSVPQAYESAIGDFNSRIWALVSVESEGLSMDILLHKSYSIAGVLTSHDSNVNQCAATLGGGVIWMGGVPPTEVKVLKPISQKRANRLREIADNIGLPVDEDSFTFFTKDEDDSLEYVDTNMPF